MLLFYSALLCYHVYELLHEKHDINLKRVARVTGKKCKLKGEYIHQFVFLCVRGFTHCNILFIHALYPDTSNDRFVFSSFSCCHNIHREPMHSGVQPTALGHSFMNNRPLVRHFFIISFI